MINDFYIRAPSFLKSVPQDGWEWLALMQHRRMPTRLVDWTENPLQALYFALSSWSKNKINERPVVYLLNSNKVHNINNGTPFLADNDRLSEFLPETLRFFKSFNNLIPKQKELPDRILSANEPVSIYIPHIDSRISKQAGCFTLHGIYQKCLYEYIIEKKDKPNSIKKIILNQKDSNIEYTINDILNDLKLLGVDAATIYGDLEYLSESIKKSHCPNP